MQLYEIPSESMVPTFLIKDRAAVSKIDCGPKFPLTDTIKEVLKYTSNQNFNENKKDTLLLYILLIYGFNHMIRFNRAGDFNLPVGNVDFNKNVKKALEAYLNFTNRHSLIFSNSDYKDFIKSFSVGIKKYSLLELKNIIGAVDFAQKMTVFAALLAIIVSSILITSSKICSSCSNFEIG